MHISWLNNTFSTAAIANEADDESLGCVRKRSWPLWCRSNNLTFIWRNLVRPRKASVATVGLQTENWTGDSRYDSEILFNRDVQCTRVCPLLYHFDFVDLYFLAFVRTHWSERRNKPHTGACRKQAVFRLTVNNRQSLHCLRVEFIFGKKESIIEMG
jgi:hypothetical protein